MPHEDKMIERPRSIGKSPVLAMSYRKLEGDRAAREIRALDPAENEVIENPNIYDLLAGYVRARTRPK